MPSGPCPAAARPLPGFLNMATASPGSYTVRKLVVGVYHGQNDKANRARDRTRARAQDTHILREKSAGMDNSLLAPGKKDALRPGTRGQWFLALRGTRREGANGLAELAGAW